MRKFDVAHNVKKRGHDYSHRTDFQERDNEFSYQTDKFGLY